MWGRGVVKGDKEGRGRERWRGGEGKGEMDERGEKEEMSDGSF